MKLSDTTKNAVVLLVVLIVAVYLYYAFVAPGGTEVFEKGAKIDRETFLELFSGSPSVYIVMDLRGASSQPVKVNIMQCGVDFAGSSGLVGRNVTYLSMDVNECYFSTVDGGAEKTTDISRCIAMLDDGMSLYIIEGNQTEYYTKAAVIGVNEDYVVGVCGLTG